MVNWIECESIKLITHSIKIRLMSWIKLLIELTIYQSIECESIQFGID